MRFFLLHLQKNIIIEISVVGTMFQALRLAGAAKKSTSVGEIVNLMAVDSQKVQDACGWSVFLWEVRTECSLALKN